MQEVRMGALKLDIIDSPPPKKIQNTKFQKFQKGLLSLQLHGQLVCQKCTEMYKWPLASHALWIHLIK